MAEECECEDIIKSEPVEVEEGMEEHKSPADVICLPQVRNKAVASLLQEIRECLKVHEGGGKQVTRNQKFREMEADLQREKLPAKKSRFSGGRAERSTGAEVDVDDVEEVEQKFIPIPEMRHGEPRIAKAKRTNKKKKVISDADRESDSLRKQQRCDAMSEEELNKIHANASEEKRCGRANLEIAAERVKLTKEELIKKYGENGPELEDKTQASLLDERQRRERNRLRMAERRSKMTEEEREVIRKRERERKQRRYKALLKAAGRVSNMEASAADLVEDAREIKLNLKREQTGQRRKNPQVLAEQKLSGGEVEDEQKRSLAKFEEIRKKNKEYSKRQREMKKVERLTLGLSTQAPRRTKEERQLERRYADALKRRRGQPERTPEEDSAFLELEKARFKALEERRRKLHNLPEMTEEERLKWIEKVKERVEREQVRNRQRRAQMTEEDKKKKRLNEYLRRCAERAERRGEEDSPEEKERQLAFARKWRQSLTGEKRQRYLDSVSRAHKKWMEKVKQDPEMWQKHKDKFNEKMRNITKNETEEERQKRLLKQKLYQSRKKFRKDLEDSRCSQEEIHSRTEEFTENFYLEYPIVRPKRPPPGRKLVVMMDVSERAELPAPHDPPALNVNSIPISQPSSDAASGKIGAILSQSEEDQVPDEVSSRAFEKNHEVEAGSQMCGLGLKPSFQHDFDDDFDYNSLDDGEDSLSVPVPTLNKEPSPKPTDITNENERIEDERAESHVEPEVSFPQTKSKVGSRKTEFTTSTMCEDCGKVLTNHRNYLRHRRRLHEDPRKCPHPQCDFKYRFSHQLWKHFPRVHVQKERSGEYIPENPVPPESEKISSASGPERLINRKKQSELIAAKSNSMCPECGKIFKTKCTVDDHIRRVHQGKGFYCDLCLNGGDLQSAGKLWKHKVEKHGLTDLPPPPNLQVRDCEFCGEKVLRSYKHHVLKKHPEMKDKIPDFVLEFGEKAQIVHLEESDKVPGCVKCPKCSTVIQKHSLKRHLSSVHGMGEQKRFPCTNCGHIFKHRNSLNHHAKKCLEKIVNGRFPNENACGKRTRAPSKCAPCVLCGARFVFRRELQEHLRESHLQEYESMEKGENPTNIPLECQACSESFADFHQLREHLELTHPENSLKCPKCEKVMLSSVELALHISMDHHNDVKVKKPRKKYPRRATSKKRKRKPRCFRCDEKFPTPKELSEHVQSVHPASYFPCLHCSSFLYSERVLAFHILRRCKKIEDKAKAQKEMAKNGQIPIHMVKIKCKLCSTGGLILSTLTKHMRRAHQITEASFECEHCRMKPFKTREYWIAHLENEHGTLVEDVYERAASEEEDDDVDKKKKSKKVQIRKKSGTGSSRRGRPRKRRLEPEGDDDDDDEENQLETLEHSILTETRPRRRQPRRNRRVLSLNLKNTITQPCFVRLIRMSDKEINEIIASAKVKVEYF